MLKFNPGDSTALYSSADKGISILKFKCKAPTSAHQDDIRQQEEVWDATKGNATYVKVIKQAKSKDVSLPAHDFDELRSIIATFCVLLFTLFGEGCDLYWSMFQILQILSHPFCMQNKQAYTPEVCCQIMWTIIVNTRSFFGDIQLVEDFLEHGDYMQFPASTLEGGFMSIKHGIKNQQHNFPLEWGTPEPQYSPPVPYYLGKTGGRGYQPVVLPLIPLPGTYQPPLQKNPTQPYNWRPANWVDERHHKIGAMTEPLPTKYHGWCLVSNILTAGTKGLILFLASMHTPEASAGYTQLPHAPMDHNTHLRQAK